MNYFLDREIVHELCVNILLQAARDWRELIKIEAYNLFSPYRKVPEELHYNGETYNTIRAFFKSDFGEGVCDEVGEDASRMINALEQKRISILKKERERVEELGKHRVF